MSQRLLRIAVHQTSLVVAVMMAVVALVFAVPAAIAFAAFGPGEGPGAWLFLLAPLWYFVIGYLTTAVFSWAYNRIGAPLGGIEVLWSPPARGVSELP